jgi:hypothetical protein
MSERARVYEDAAQRRREIERKRALLHKKLAEDPDFIRESEELQRKIQNGERSSDTIPASELRRRLRGGKTL